MTCQPQLFTGAPWTLALCRWVLRGHRRLSWGNPAPRGICRSRDAVCLGASEEAAQRQHHDWLTMQGVSPWNQSRCKEVA